MNGQFNYTPHTPADIKVAGLGAVILSAVAHLNQQFKLLSRALRGAVVFDVGASGTAVTINPAIADVCALRLTENTTVTLSLTDVRRGMYGDIEFLQDATGSRTVAFTNLLNAAPTITSTAGKRTLVRFTHVGDGWVATLLASNF